MNTEGITHEESLVNGLNRSNSMNWIAGHLLATRDSFLIPFGKQAFMTEKESSIYRRGAPALLPGSTCVEFQRILKGLARTGDDLAAEISKSSAQELEDSLDPDLFPVRVDPPTRGNLFTLVLFHEAYHAGQIGLCRRLLGKEGIIR